MVPVLFVSRWLWISRGKNVANLHLSLSVISSIGSRTEQNGHITSVAVGEYDGGGGKVRSSWHSSAIFFNWDSNGIVAGI